MKKLNCAGLFFNGLLLPQSGNGAIILEMNLTLPENSDLSTQTATASSSTAGSERHPDPKGWRDYLSYPRVLITLVLCGFALVSHVAFAVYVWFFER